MPFTVGSIDPGVGGLADRRSRTIVGTKLNNNLNKIKQKERKKGWFKLGDVRTDFTVMSRTSIRKGVIRWIGNIRLDG